MNDRLAPGLLIAAPSMPDERFAGTVILLAEANSEGALGFVINKPMDLTCDLVGQEIGVDVSDALADSPVFRGGPVSPERGWILFRDPARYESSLDEDLIHTLHDDIQLGATVDLLREFFSQRDRRPFRFMLGCSGWGSGQLEAEIGEGSWIPMELQSALVFDTPPEALWERALEEIGLTRGTFLTTSGGSA